MRLETESRHSCRGLRVTVLAAAALTGCMTIVPVQTAGRARDDRAIDDLAAQPRAFARLTSPAPPLRPLATEVGPYRIVDHRPGWLTLSDHESTVAVPVARLQSLSTYSRVRGTLEGAVPAGVVMFGLGFAFRAFLLPRGCAADGPCEPPVPVAGALKWGAVSGAVGALVGGALGAAVGHETRYKLVPIDE